MTTVYSRFESFISFIDLFIEIIIRFLFLINHLYDSIDNRNTEKNGLNTEYSNPYTIVYKSISIDLYTSINIRILMCNMYTIYLNIKFIDETAYKRSHKTWDLNISLQQFNINITLPDDSCQWCFIEIKTLSFSLIDDLNSVKWLLVLLNFFLQIHWTLGKKFLFYYNYYSVFLLSL